MKDYKEMANDVLDRIHEYDAVKVQKRKKIAKVITVVCPISVLAITGLIVWKAELLIPSGNHADINISFTEQIQTSSDVPDRTIQTDSRNFPAVESQTVSTSMNNNPFTESYISEKEISYNSNTSSVPVSAIGENSEKIKSTEVSPEVSLSEPSVMYKSTESEIKSDISDSSNYYKSFSSIYNPDADAYSEDELALVEVIISGNHYSQLDISEYPDYNIPYKISDSDFGEFIGNVVEVSDNITEYAVYSKEPYISDAEVYYYAPANSNSIVIVKKNRQCSIFIFTGQKMYSSNSYSSFEESFSYYGAVSSSDIRSISYTISIPDDGLYKISSEGIIEDSNRINSITDILKQLIPEENIESTPQWYIDRMSAYKANPDAYAVENIMLEIHFNNGTVMKDIEYQPFIGNGYVSGMKELNISQNTELRSLLD